MKIYYEVDIDEFEFWEGGKCVADSLSEDDLEVIQNKLEELYPDGMSDTELNDLFWHDEDFIAGLAGYSSFEKVKEGIKSDEEDEIYDEAYWDDEIYENEKEDRIWRKYERDLD
jgi:hypothetical protein